jgi:hypothetical protein
VRIPSEVPFTAVLPKQRQTNAHCVYFEFLDAMYSFGTPPTCFPMKSLDAFLKINGHGGLPKEKQL